MGGQLSITSNTLIGNGPVSQVVGPLYITNVTPVLENIALTFTGAQFISTTAPLGSCCCIIIPPSSNLIQLTLKGITGDTGIPISANFPAVVPFFNPQSSSNAIGLTSAAAIPTGVVNLYFF